MFSHIFKGGFLTPFGSHSPNFWVDFYFPGTAPSIASVGGQSSRPKKTVDRLKNCRRSRSGRIRGVWYHAILPILRSNDDNRTFASFISCLWICWKRSERWMSVRVTLRFYHNFISTYQYCCSMLLLSNLPKRSNFSMITMAGPDPGCWLGQPRHWGHDDERDVGYSKSVFRGWNWTQNGL